MEEIFCDKIILCEKYSNLISNYSEFPSHIGE